MPELSVRSKRLPESPIRKLVPFAEKAKKSGTKIFHLNIGQPDIPTPPEFFQAIQAANPEVLAYSHSAGNESLRGEIANYYRAIGHELSVDEINVTTGASEALSFIFASILDGGEEVIVPEPFYANYNSFTLANEGNVIPITTRIEDDFALPSIDAFEEKISDKTRAILICNPGNPTGILYPENALQRLTQIVRKHDLFLIADEVYREFAYDGLAHHSTLGMSEIRDHVIVVDSISKRFSACGARIGCVISRNRDLMQSILKLSQARLSPPTYGQIGAEAVYRLPPTYYDGVVAEYSSRRDQLKKSLDEIDGVVCPAVNGAFYSMVRLPVDSAEKFCRWMLEEFEFEGATVMMAPGEGFYATPGLGVDEVRIAYVLNNDDLKSAMQCLAAGLNCYPGRKV